MITLFFFVIFVIHFTLGIYLMLQCSHNELEAFGNLKILNLTLGRALQFTLGCHLYTKCLTYPLFVFSELDSL